jgi:peptidoglycan/xylan/chitin deacetylase (PgdA/CDA1 family)
MRFIKKIFLVIFIIVLYGNNVFSAEKITREVAITMDGLAVADQDKILEVYKKFGIIGAFGVLEGRDLLEVKSEDDLKSTIRRYLEKGHIVFNHTANHRDANVETLDEFKSDVIEGENVLEKTIKEGDFKQSKYFRFPYLSRGLLHEDRVLINNFLKEKGYTVLPITIDSLDWKFDVDYIKALEAKDIEKVRKIENIYFNYLKKIIPRQELWAQSLLDGRNPRHILLMHNAKITVNNLEKVLQIFIDAGYKFIPLDEAMEDKIYKVDTITDCKNDGGCSGGSQLSHLGIINGVKESFRKKNPKLFDFPEY